MDFVLKEMQMVACKIHGDRALEFAQGVTDEHLLARMKEVERIDC